MLHKIRHHQDDHHKFFGQTWKFETTCSWSYMYYKLHISQL